MSTRLKPTPDAAKRLIAAGEGELFEALFQWVFKPKPLGTTAEGKPN